MHTNVSDEIIGGRRKLHNEERHNLCSSPNTIRMMKSRRMGGAGHLVLMERRGIYTGLWWEIQKKRDH
jgi:hypothetical protein